MPKRKRRHKSPGGIKKLFAQPPTGLYGRTTLYQSGNELELENFKTLLDYQETKIRIQMKNGTLTIYGDGLEIAALETKRLRIRGMVLKTEFSYGSKREEGAD